MESQGGVKVRVKSASLSCEDVDVECNMSYKVKELKELIRVKSPMHPEIADQRLIYAGHLLDDEQILRDVLMGNTETSSQISNASFTVHLATTLRGLGKTPQSDSFKKSSTMGSQHATQPQQIPIRVEPTTTATPIVELPNFQFGNSGGIPPDVLALHQQYVEQMMQYMMNWSQMTLGFVPPLYAPYTTNTPTSNSFVPPPANDHNQQPVNPPPNIDVQEVNVRVNEVANRAGDEDEAPRDFLDWMYTIIRVALIFSVVYFYSNFTRFFLVVLFTALVMVFQRRQVIHQAEAVAEQRQEVNNPPAPAAPSETAQMQPETPATNNTQGENGAGTSKVQATSSVNDETAESSTRLNNGDPSSTTHEESLNGPVNEDGSTSTTTTLPETSEPPRRSVRDITLTFLTTFFTSLIPQMPQNN